VWRRPPRSFYLPAFERNPRPPPLPGGGP